MYTICKWIPTPVTETIWIHLLGKPKPVQKKPDMCHAFHDLKELTMRIMSYADYKMTRHSPVSYDSLLGRKDRGGEIFDSGGIIHSYWSINWGAVWKIGGIITNCEGDSGNLLKCCGTSSCIPNKFSTMVSTSNSSQKRVPPFFFLVDACWWYLQ